MFQEWECECKAVSALRMGSHTTLSSWSQMWGNMSMCRLFREQVWGSVSMPTYMLTVRIVSRRNMCVRARLVSGLLLSVGSFEYAHIVSHSYRLRPTSHSRFNAWNKPIAYVFHRWNLWWAEYLEYLCMFYISDHELSHEKVQTENLPGEIQSQLCEPTCENHEVPSNAWGGQCGPRRCRFESSPVCQLQT